MFFLHIKFYFTIFVMLVILGPMLLEETSFDFYIYIIMSFGCMYSSSHMLVF